MAVQILEVQLHPYPTINSLVDNIIETASSETLNEISKLSLIKLMTIYNLLAPQLETRYDLTNHPLIQKYKGQGEKQPVDALTLDIIGTLWERLGAGNRKSS